MLGSHESAPGAEKERSGAMDGKTRSRDHLSTWLAGSRE
jgi:hypothetical protein